MPGLTAEEVHRAISVVTLWRERHYSSHPAPDLAYTVDELRRERAALAVRVSQIDAEILSAARLIEDMSAGEQEE